MATIKAVLKPDKKKDETFPIVIRITKDRKTSYVPVGFSVKKVHWDTGRGCCRNNCDDAAIINNEIAQRIAEISQRAVDLEKERPEISAASIKASKKKRSVPMFFEQAEEYLESLKEAGKYNQYTADKPRVNHFKIFLNGNISFQEINVSVLERFKSYIKNNLKLSERSAVNHLSMVRSVFSYARKGELIKPDLTPFGKGKIVIKFPETGKIGLNATEIKSLENAVLSTRPHHCRNLWMFSFYFAGMRVSDVLRLKWKDFQNGRLVYIMGKNDKAGSLKVSQKAQAILDEYRKDKRSENDFVFPELKGVDQKDLFIMERTIAFKTSAIDKCLKKDVAPAAGIEKKLTMHIARHSFATEAGDKINIQMLQKLYRHSQITTTIGYQSAFINKDTDDALDAVLNNNHIN